MKNTLQSHLVFCGLENLNEIDVQAEWTIFGDYMSKSPFTKPTPKVSLFPYDQETQRAIQTREEIKFQDLQVIKLYNKLLASLTEVLNDTHQENMSIRQWELVIGYWLRHFIDAIMVRWVLVGAALEGDFDQYYLLDNDLKAPLAVTRNDFATLCNDSKLWNQRLLSDIARQLIPEERAEKIQFIASRNLLCDAIKCKNQNKSVRGLKNGLKRTLKKAVEILGQCYLGSNAMVIYSPILSITEMIRLTVKLRKFPVIYFLKDYSGSDEGRYSESAGNYNQKVENRAALSVINTFDDKFSRFVASAVGDQLPKCYLEQWSSLNSQMDQLKLPVKTEMIYAGSGIITDECFRLYVARQVDLGCQFIVSQHGGVYGVSLIQEKTEFVEQRVSDKWISWGWNSAAHKNVIPGPNLKLPPKRPLLKKATSQKMESLLVALPPIRFSPSRLNYSDPTEIVETHIKFLQSLDQAIVDKTIIRPAPNHRSFKYVSNFAEHFELSLNGSFWDDADRSRLFLCTHNATTLLEALSSNLPTVILLPRYRFYTQHYLRSDAQPWFDKLGKVNMYFEDANEARRHIDAIWSDVNAWWNLEEVQAARQAFCENFCQAKEDRLDELAKAISLEEPKCTDILVNKQSRRVAAK